MRGGISQHASEGSEVITGERRNDGLEFRDGMKEAENTYCVI